MVTLQRVLTRSAAVLAIATGATAPGVVINFDSLDATQRPSNMLTIAHYVASFGVPLVGSTFGSDLMVVNTVTEPGFSGARPKSRNNVLTVWSGGQPSSFMLLFSTPQASIDFTRPGLWGSPISPVVHPAWTMSTFDVAGRLVASVSAAEIASTSVVRTQRYGVRGEGIVRVVFSSFPTADSSFDAVLVDDIVTSTTPAPGTVCLLLFGLAAMVRRR